MGDEPASVTAATPRLSIVTPALNSARTIRATLESVASQAYASVEHLVQDGGSTDATLAIVREFPAVKLVSGKDTGLYDAMNRGIHRAKGDFVAVLNSDDCYRARALETVAAALARDPQLDGVFGDVVYVDGDGREIFRRAEATFDYDVLRFGLCYVTHPTFFLRKSVFDALGGFRSSEFAFCCDYDLFLRVARAGYRIGHVPAYLADFRIHDFGRSADRRVQQKGLEEAQRLRKEHGLPAGPLGVAVRTYARALRQLQKLVIRHRVDVIPGALRLRAHMRDRTAFSSNSGDHTLDEVTGGAAPQARAPGAPRKGPSPPPVHVLIVGQTPPPFHGQAVMIDNLVRARFARVRVSHVRMAFSRDIGEIGNVSARKVAHLAAVIARTVRALVKERVDILYYPPSGGSRSAMLRDVAILLAARPLVRKTVFHLHADGLAELHARLSAPERAAFALAFSAPDCTIRGSELAPPDGALMMTKRDVVVPHGIADVAPAYPRDRPGEAVPVLLFVGQLCETKGVRVLIDACAILARRSLEFEVELVGDWASPEYAATTNALLRSANLVERFRIRGVLTGAEKHRAYANADIFCFPTYYETFGLVALEAMSFGLPVVASNWRALPSIIDDGTSGYLVAPRDAHGLADRLGELLRDREKARAMGREGRARFLARYTLERHLAAIEQVFVEVASAP